jgi:hypothetical protein
VNARSSTFFNSFLRTAVSRFDKFYFPVDKQGSRFYANRFDSPPRLIFLERRFLERRLVEISFHDFIFLFWRLINDNTRFDWLPHFLGAILRDQALVVVLRTIALHYKSYVLLQLEFQTSRYYRTFILKVQDAFDCGSET